MKIPEQFPEAAFKKLLKLADAPDEEGLYDALRQHVEEDRRTYERLRGFQPARKPFERVLAAAAELEAAMTAAGRERILGKSWLNSWHEIDPTAHPDLPQTALRNIKLAAASARMLARKSGGPKRRDQFEVIRAAMKILLIFRRGRPPLQPGDRDRFIEAFFETVTGTRVRLSDMEWTVRQVRKDLESIGAKLP